MRATASRAGTYFHPLREFLEPRLDVICVGSKRKVTQILATLYDHTAQRCVGAKWKRWCPSERTRVWVRERAGTIYSHTRSCRKVALRGHSASCLLALPKYASQSAAGTF